jgi:hypothetical protein
MFSLKRVRTLRQTL